MRKDNSPISEDISSLFLSRLERGIRKSNVRGPAWIKNTVEKHSSKFNKKKVPKTTKYLYSFISHIVDYLEKLEKEIDKYITAQEDIRWEVGEKVASLDRKISEVKGLYEGVSKKVQGYNDNLRKLYQFIINKFNRYDEKIGELEGKMSSVEGRLSNLEKMLSTPFNKEEIPTRRLYLPREASKKSNVYSTRVEISDMNYNGKVKVVLEFSKFSEDDNISIETFGKAEQGMVEFNALLPQGYKLDAIKVYKLK